MPNSITTSLSRYIGPSYVVDFFAKRSNGKSISSRLFASSYNTLASSILATQIRLQSIFSTSTNLDTTVKLNFYSNTSIPLVQRDSGGAIQSWQTLSNPSGQNGLSTGSIDNYQFTSGIVSDFFYGQKAFDSGAGEWYRIGFRDNVNNPGLFGSPVVVANMPSINTTDTFDPITNQNITQVINKKKTRCNSTSLSSTPYHSLLLRNATNADNSSTVSSLIDRYALWDSPSVLRHQNYNTVRSRVIIGASRGFSIGRQAVPNKQVYNPSTTGSVTSVPSGFSPEDKTLLGPGALFVTGTFYIPVETSVSAPSNYSSYGLNENALQNRFFCYPGLNCTQNHGVMSPINSGIISHVLVFGLS